MTEEAAPSNPTPPPAAAPAPAAPAPNKALVYLSQVPSWLWAASASSLVFFSAFLIFVSQQTPDQYAMTAIPPWQHTMNHKELIAYHRALKSGAFDGNELEAKKYLYNTSRSRPMYASQTYSQPPRMNQQHPQTLPKRTPQKPLTIEDITGFASRSEPLNKQTFQQAQAYVALERNPYGMIDSNQIASQIPPGIYIQTASLRSIRDASQLRQNLKQRGYAPFIQEALIQGQTWYRVRFGPYANMADAQEAAQQLRANRYAAQVINTP